MINKLKAGFSHFHVQAEETGNAIDWIEEQVQEYNPEFTITKWGFTSDTPDPMEALLEAEEKSNEVIILKNYHWFLSDNGTPPNPNPETVQFIQDRLDLYRSRDKRRILITINNKNMVNSIPAELIRDFVEIVHDLPDKEEIRTILDRVEEQAVKNLKFKKPDEETRKKMVSGALGMTRFEVDNSFRLSLVKTAAFTPSEVIEMRTTFLESVAGVKYLQYRETFKELKGLAVLKNISKKFIKSDLALGLCLIGPPGTGKSHFAKALSGETGIPMLTVEMAEWQGGIVGETEEKVRKALAAFGVFEEIILFIDEIEKGLAGVGGPQTVSSDSVTERGMAQFLKFLSDRIPGKKIFIIATCNSIMKMPPEYLRAERWDTAPIYIGLPDSDTRKEILEHYKKVYGVSGKLKGKDTKGWSGAELKAVCRIANMLEVSIDKAVNFVVPISVTKAEDIKELERRANKGEFIKASGADTNGDSVRSLDF